MRCLKSFLLFRNRQHYRTALRRCHVVNNKPTTVTTQPTTNHGVCCIPVSGNRVGTSAAFAETVTFGVCAPLTSVVRRVPIPLGWLRDTPMVAPANTGGFPNVIFLSLPRDRDAPSFTVLAVLDLIGSAALAPILAELTSTDDALARELSGTRLSADDGGFGTYCAMFKSIGTVGLSGVVAGSVTLSSGSDGNVGTVGSVVVPLPAPSCVPSTGGAGGVGSGGAGVLLSSSTNGGFVGFVVLVGGVGCELADPSEDELSAGVAVAGCFSGCTSPDSASASAIVCTGIPSMSTLPNNINAILFFMMFPP